VDQIGHAQPWSTGGPLFYLSSIATHDLLLGLAMLVGLAVAARSLRHERPLPLLVMAVAVILQLVLYSLSATKKPFYLLTAYPFAAILGAWALHRLLGTVTRRIGLAIGLVAVVFVLTCGPLLYPDVAVCESTYLRPLATQAEALVPAGRPWFALDVYLAAPQFYSHRPVIYVVREQRVQQMLSRIPYLRYANNVVTWHHDLLAGGALAIVPAPLGRDLLAGVPGVEIVARNQGFWLVKGPS
jgi:4-amino-4-deoxy-L-arabinose transferase-like glycosyltransferase